MRALLALYPRTRRRRYGAEFAAVLDEQPASPRVLFDVLLAAIDAHLDPQVADEGEAPLRRQLKEVLMNVLRSRPVLSLIGLLVPFLFLAVSYLSPEIRHGGMALPMAVALASGLLVGRWWAPVPFVGISVVWLLAVERTALTGDGYGWFLQVVIAWTLACLIGVIVRMFLGGELVNLGDPSDPSAVGRS